MKAVIMFVAYDIIHEGHVILSGKLHITVGVVHGFLKCAFKVALQL